MTLFINEANAVFDEFFNFMLPFVKFYIVYIVPLIFCIFFIIKIYHFRRNK